MSTNCTIFEKELLKGSQRVKKKKPASKTLFESDTFYLHPENGQLQQSHHSGKIFEKRKSPNRQIILGFICRVWAIII